MELVEPVRVSPLHICLFLTSTSLYDILSLLVWYLIVIVHTQHILPAESHSAFIFLHLACQSFRNTACWHNTSAGHYYNRLGNAAHTA